MRAQGIVGVEPVWLVSCDIEGCTAQEVLIRVRDARAIADLVVVPDISDDDAASREIAECIAIERGYHTPYGGEHWTCPACSAVAFAALKLESAQEARRG